MIRIITAAALSMGFLFLLPFLNNTRRSLDKPIIAYNLKSFQLAPPNLDPDKEEEPPTQKKPELEEIPQETLPPTREFRQETLMISFDLNLKFSFDGIEGIPVAMQKPGPVKHPLPEIKQGGELLFAPEPAVPLRAKKLGINGKVKAEIHVDEKGNVSRVVILNSKPPKMFDKSVIQAVMRYRFSPARNSTGQPIKFIRIGDFIFD